MKQIETHHVFSRVTVGMLVATTNLYVKGVYTDYIQRYTYVVSATNTYFSFFGIHQPTNICSNIHNYAAPILEDFLELIPGSFIQQRPHNFVGVT